jgi:tetratricopeptide (TPR) repeat protein
MSMTRFNTVRPGAWQQTVIGACLLCLAPGLSCTPLGEEGTSISRGDQAFAKGDPEEALAEYRLALRQGSTSPETYARVAHTYVALGRVDEARESYRLAVAQDSAMADQAVTDFAHLAREELRTGDRFGMASAVRTALEFRPGISLPDLALPLAQHYSDIGEYGRALPFFLKTLSAIDPDSVPEVLFQTAVAYDEVGDCESAVVYYSDYRERLPPWGGWRSEVDWRLGNCSFQLARMRRAEGETEEALGHLETLLSVGEPRNLLAMAYFEKGEILGLQGECEAAVEAFREVPVMDPAGTSPLVARAEERIDQIRFGGRFQGLFGSRQRQDSTQSCFPPDSQIRTNRRGGG